MTVDPWLAWLAFGISTAVYLIAAATASTFAAGPLAWARASEPNGSPDNDGETLSADIARLNFGGITAASRAVAVAAVIAASFALAFALEATSLALGASLAVAGISMGACLFILTTAISRLEISSRRRIRVLLLPAGKALHFILSAPGIRIAMASPGGFDSDEPKSEDDVLDDGLSLLEAAGISPDPGELEMIRAVLRLDRARVREIMQPRVDMVTAEASVGFDELAAIMTDAGHSRIPIFDDTIDQIVGVVHSQDLLRAHTTSHGDGERPTMKELARSALFVPEAQMLDQLLREFQRARTQIAIVIDEYGGVAGLVTVQDLIEEIVGELVDEFDTDEPEMQRISEQELRMDARMPLDTLRQELGVDIDDTEGFDTVGGLVYRELGKMPTPGDQVAIDGIRLTVESTMGRRIRHIRVRRVLPPLAADAKAN